MIMLTTCIKTVMPAERIKNYLADYVTRIFREKGLSGYNIEVNSKRGGGPSITQSYANRIKNGVIRNPSPEKLKALARGMGVPETELFAAARGSVGEEAEIAHEKLAAIDFAYENMPPGKRARADDLIALLEREIKRIENDPER